MFDLRLCFQDVLSVVRLLMMRHTVSMLLAEGVLLAEVLLDVEKQMMALVMMFVSTVVAVPNLLVARQMLALTVMKAVLMKLVFVHAVVRM